MLSAVRTLRQPSFDTVNRVSVPNLLPLLQIAPSSKSGWFSGIALSNASTRGIVDLIEQWVRQNIRIEDTRIVKLRDQIEIGDGRFVVEGERVFVVRASSCFSKVW